MSDEERDNFIESSSAGAPLGDLGLRWLQGGGSARGSDNTSQNSSSMLSINFSTPLAGAARSERIKQMTNTHPAFTKARKSTEIINNIQTSLRKMPGVSARESNEINAKLSEIGQIVTQETSQLVDALMHLTLDQEDTDKAVARMSLDANIAKAQAEDQATELTKLQGALNALQEELTKEHDKREQAEAEIAKVMQDLQSLTRVFKSESTSSKEPREGGGVPLGSDTSSSPSREEMIKHLEDTIQQLEGQVNNRRSLWVMKHSSPNSVARAIETIAGSCQDKEAVHKSIMNLRSEPDVDHDGIEPTPSRDPKKSLAQALGEMSMGPGMGPSGMGPVGMGPVGMRPSTAFQPVRPNSVAPPRFGPLEATQGHRAPSASSASSRVPSRMQQHWAPVTPAQQTPRLGMLPSNHHGPGPIGGPTQGYGRAPSRRGFQQGPGVPSTFRKAETFHSGFQQQQQQQPERLYGSRPESAFATRRDFYPSTPSNVMVRGRYSRTRDAVSPDYDAGNAAAVMGHGQGQGYGHGHPSFPSPLIHLTEMTVAAWNEQVMGLYGAIRVFVEHNACAPTRIRPTDLASTRLWPILLATYFPLSDTEAISYLDVHLKEQSAKSCLVTRVIIDYIVNRIWVPRAWAGADDDADFGLMEVAENLDRTQGQPSSHRQPILDRQAAVVDSILKLDHYRQFSKLRMGENAETLFGVIEPLLNADARPDAALADLEVVSRLAWALSSRILSSRLTFDFRFPEVGSRFSCQSMIPIWPELDPMELQAKHWRVALVTTPVITCRNDTGANISAHSVSLADVVCMQ